MYSNGVAGILELKKRPPDVAVASDSKYAGNSASKPVSARGSFAGLPIQDLDISLLSLLNWSPCHIIEQSLAVC